MCFPEGRFTDLWEDELKTARLIARPRLRSRLHGFALLPPAVPIIVQYLCKIIWSVYNPFRPLVFTLCTIQYL